MSDRFDVEAAYRDVASGFILTSELESADKIPVSFWLAENGEDIQQAALAMMATPLKNRLYLSAAELQARFGADPATVETVKAFAKKHGLEPVAGGENSRLITMHVQPGQVEELFGVDLKTYRSNDKRTCRGRTGTINLLADDFPDEGLRRNVIAVFGLDNRRQARHFSIQGPGGSSTTVESKNMIETHGEFKADLRTEVAAGSPYPPLVYGFPNVPAARNTPRTKPTLTGKGQTVGIVEFGGDLTVADLATPPATSKQVSVVSFRQGGASYLDPNLLQETKMDVAIVFQCAPGIDATVFLLDESEQGWTAGLNGILALDPIPSVLSVSWGWAENSIDPKTQLWTPAAISAIEDLLAALVLRGVTTVVASGDLGWRICYPGSSAFVLSCGASITPGPREAVWTYPAKASASGGGISDEIPMPSWQARAGIVCNGAGLPTATNGKRCLPDVAAWGVFPNNSLQGTSAAAPIWAGLMALANEQLTNQGQPVAGNINALLYDPQTGLQETCNDIVIGNNSISITGGKPFYRASCGWDACTGWGSPNAMEFIETLAKSDPSASAEEAERDGEPAPD